MSKYDAKLDLKSVNSLSLIVNNIKDNSVILEFGPATGRLTRYLKEELSCKVYIVEIDSTGYEKAIQYAEDGYLGDIEEYQWLDKFKGIQFDYILFADVLEHLRKPEVTIQHSKALLKEDGKIISSIPNVAHNSVIYNLLNNEFHYNKLGLLDDTHIHLFTYKSAKRLFEQNNLSIIKEEATYTKEQPGEFPFSLNECNQLEDEVLKKHPMGQVYQFIFVAVNKETNDNQKLTIEKKIKDFQERDMCTLYLDRGNGFSQHDIMQQPISEGLNHIFYELRNCDDIKMVRLDFLEKFACVIHIRELKVNGLEQDLDKIVGNFIGNIHGVLVYDETDPFVYLEDPLNKINYVEVTFEVDKLYNHQKLVINYLSDYSHIEPLIELKDNHIVNIEAILNQLEDNSRKQSNKINQLSNCINKKDELIQQLKDLNKSNNLEIEQLKKSIDEKSKLNLQLNESIHENESTIQQLNQSLLQVNNEI